MNEDKDYVKTVKSVSTRRFSVEMYEVHGNKYKVSWAEGNEELRSRPTDYITANLIFDDVLARLQGN